MRRALLLLAETLCGTIPLTILYEKNDSSYSRRLAAVLVRDALGSYNRVLRKAGIELVLVLARLADYTTYSRAAEFRGLADLAGGDGLDARLAALQNFRGNVIVLVAAPNAEQAGGVGKVGLCGTRMLVDLGSQGSVGAVAVLAVQQWLSRLLRRHVPDPFLGSPSRSLVEALRKSRLQERAKRCLVAETARNDSLEEAGLGNVSSSTGGGDAFSSDSGFAPRSPGPSGALQGRGGPLQNTFRSSRVQIDHPFASALQGRAPSTVERLPRLGSVGKVRRFQLPGRKT